MAVRGTLFGAIRGYMMGLEAVQRLRWAEAVGARLGLSLPPEIQSAIVGILEGSEKDRDAILAEIGAARPFYDAADRRVLDAAEAYVRGVYQETLLYQPGVPTEGIKLGQPLGPAIRMLQWARAWAAAQKETVAVANAAGKIPYIGPWLKKALGWVIVGTAAGAGVIALYRVWQRTDPLYGISVAIEGKNALEAAKQRAVTRCGDDKACIEREIGWFTKLDDAIPIPGREGECGLLDTPTGTLIGLLAGAGFGWAGMKRLKRLGGK